MMAFTGRSAAPAIKLMRMGQMTACTHTGGDMVRSTIRAAAAIRMHSGIMMKKAGPSAVSWPANDSPQASQAGRMVT